MSQQSIVRAAVAHLRTQLSLDVYTCDETDDGKPTPSAGPVFYGVHPGEWRNSADDSLDETYGVLVTITMRLDVPWDRAGPELLGKATTGLAARCAALRVKVHSSYTLMDLANTLIADPANKFVEPLRFTDGGRRARRGGDWWIASGKEKYAGYSQTMTFGRARRVQLISEMT